MNQLLLILIKKRQQPSIFTKNSNLMFFLKFFCVFDLTLRHQVKGKTVLIAFNEKKGMNIAFKPGNV